MPEFEFNGAKFKELVLLFAERSANDEGFGMVKLNKLLWRADFESYRVLGRPITGETYERQEFGPVARHLPIVLDELAGRGYIQWTQAVSGPYTRSVPTSLEPADTSMFSGAELAGIEGVLRELAPHGGKSVSEWSHENFVGWRVRKDGDEIPYSSAILSLRELPIERREQLWARIQPRLAA
jgi:hypothetical protein